MKNLSLNMHNTICPPSSSLTMNSSEIVSNIGRRNFIQMSVGAMALFQVRRSVMAAPKTVRRIVCGFAPGGIADRLCRIVAEEGSKLTGESWIVQTMTGAGGLIAAREVSRSEPDGSNLLLSPTGIFRTRGGVIGSSWDPLKELSPLVLLGSMPLGVFVRSEHPASSVKQLVNDLRLKNEPLIFGTAGHGSSSHVMGEYLARTGQVSATHIPFSGSAQVTNALYSGQIPAAVLDPMAIEPFLVDKSIKCLGISSSRPHSRLPVVLTLNEQGFSGFNFSSWQGFHLPSSTDLNMIGHLGAIFSDLLKINSVKKVISDGYIEPYAQWGQEAQKFIEQDSRQYQSMIKRLEINLNF